MQNSESKSLPLLHRRFSECSKTANAQALQDGECTGECSNAPAISLQMLRTTKLSGISSAANNAPAISRQMLRTVKLSGISSVANKLLLGGG